MTSSQTLWSITRASDKHSWTASYLTDLLHRPCIPSRISTIGSVSVEWEQIDPGVAFVRSLEGGTYDDRRIAETIVATRLMQHGYDRAYFSFDRSRLEKAAEWEDIEAKAKRLVASGNVQLLRNGYNNIAAHVVGDHGEYNCEIGRDDPNSRAITTWQCECPWDQFAWQRTRKWKKYEGRPCAHVLGTFWLAQSTPLDEDLEPGQTLPPGQKGFQPQTPADITNLPQPMIPGMGGPAGGDSLALPGQLAPQGQPAPPSILPPFPGEQLQLVPPGQLQPGQPGITVSEPGARQPTPFNPIQNPSTYSKVSDWSFGESGYREGVACPRCGDPLEADGSDVICPTCGFIEANTDMFSELPIVQHPLGPHTGGAFNNSDMVRLEEDEYGIAEGKSEAHGAGDYKLIPKGSIGEVLGQDPTTGWVDVIFAGPQANAGPMEPYHVRALLEPGMLTPMPGVKKPGPFIKRR